MPFRVSESRIRARDAPCYVVTHQQGGLPPSELGGVERGMSDLLRADLSPAELRTLITALTAGHRVDIAEDAAREALRRRLVDLWGSLRGERQPADRGLW